MKELFNILSNVSNLLNEKRLVNRGHEGPEIHAIKEGKNKFRVPDEIKITAKRPKEEVGKALKLNANKTMIKGRDAIERADKPGAEKLREAENIKDTMGKALKKAKKLGYSFAVAQNYLIKAVEQLMEKGGAKNARKAENIVNAVYGTLAREKTIVRRSGRRSMSIPAVEKKLKAVVDRYMN